MTRPVFGETAPCPSCRTSGEDRHGARCLRCGGSGYLGLPAADPPREERREQGRAARDEGMAKAAIRAPVWGLLARQWIVGREPGTVFSADDLTDAIGPPTSRNAVGPAIAGAARQGLIVRAGIEQSAIPTSHASIIQKWRRT